MLVHMTHTHTALTRRLASIIFVSFSLGDAERASAVLLCCLLATVT